MEELLISKYMKMLEPLSVSVKLELLSRLSADLKTRIQPKSNDDKIQLLRQLSGSWKDGDISAEEILSQRTVS
jgi:hypothetical protein